MAGIGDARTGTGKRMIRRENESASMTYAKWDLCLTSVNEIPR